MIEDKKMNREDIRLQRQTMETLEFKLLVEDGYSNLTPTESCLITRYLSNKTTELNGIEKLRYLLSNWGVGNTWRYFSDDTLYVIAEPSYTFSQLCNDNKRSILELIDATRENK